MDYLSREAAPFGDALWEQIDLSLIHIFGSISQLGLMPLMGLTQGGQPIISYNYGARNYDRVRKAYHVMIAASFTLSMVCLLYTSRCV